MAEAVTGAALEVYEQQLQEISASLNEQVAALADQHAVDISTLRTEFQSDINQVTGAIGDMADQITSKIDLLIEKTGEYADLIVDALLVLQQNDVVMYEAVLYILGIMFVFVTALLAWGIYKFIRIFF